MVMDLSTIVQIVLAYMAVTVIWGTIFHFFTDATDLFWSALCGLFWPFSFPFLILILITMGCIALASAALGFRRG